MNFYNWSIEHLYSNLNCIRMAISIDIGISYFTVHFILKELFVCNVIVPTKCPKDLTIIKTRIIKVYKVHKHKLFIIPQCLS